VADDDMGKKPIHEGGGSLVESDFVHMAKEWGMSVGETKKEVLKTLKKQVEK